ncbi:20025_t:CDS:2, partial [Dentiscutata erythropus]
EIQQSDIKNEYLVPSEKKNTDLSYIVNVEIWTCTCFVGLSGAPCKHQGAVAAKYHISSLNFLQLLTPNDRANFAYIARVINEVQESEESNMNQIIAMEIENLESDVDQINTIERNTAFIESFLKIVKYDYENCGPQFQTAIEKLAERYNAAKAKSIPRRKKAVCDKKNIDHHVIPARKKRTS